MRDQHSTMEKQIGLAEKASSQTDKIIAEMQFDRRPWLGIGDTELTPVEAGREFRFTLQMVNSGKTPAMIRQLACRVIYLQKGVDVLKYYEQEVTAAKSDSAEKRNNPVLPGTPATLPISAPVPTEENVEGVNNGSLILYVVGCIVYTYGADERGHTAFSFIRVASSRVEGMFELRRYRYNEAT